MKNDEVGSAPRGTALGRVSGAAARPGSSTGGSWSMEMREGEMGRPGSSAGGIMRHDGALQGSPGPVSGAAGQSCGCDSSGRGRRLHLAAGSCGRQQQAGRPLLLLTDLCRSPLLPIACAGRDCRSVHPTQVVRSSSSRGVSAGGSMAAERWRETAPAKQQRSRQQLGAAAI